MRKQRNLENFQFEPFKISYQSSAKSVSREISRIVNLSLFWESKFKERLKEEKKSRFFKPESSTIPSWLMMVSRRTIVSNEEAATHWHHFTYNYLFWNLASLFASFVTKMVLTLSIWYEVSTKCSPYKVGGWKNEENGQIIFASKFKNVR